MRQGVAANQRNHFTSGMLYERRVQLIATLSTGDSALVLGSNAEFELRRPFGVRIVSGLILSQALTLSMTRVVYLSFYRFGRLMRRRFGGRFNTESASGSPAE